MSQSYFTRKMTGYLDYNRIPYALRRFGGAHSEAHRGLGRRHPEGIATFRHVFGRLILLGMGPAFACESLGTPAVPWGEGEGARRLCRTLAAALAAGR